MTSETSDLSRPIAEVVLLKPLDRVFHYAVPEAFRDRLLPGMRVRVPFRSDRRTGIVVRRLRRTDGIELKPILEILDSSPLLDRPMMALARWLSEYYMTGWGVTIKAILPPGLEAATQRHYRMTAAGRNAISGPFRRGEAGRRFLSALERVPRGLRLAALIRRALPNEPPPRGGLRRFTQQLSALVRKGWIEETRVLPRRQEAFPSRSAPSSVGSMLRTGPENEGPFVPEEINQAVRSGRFAAFYLEGEPERSRSVVTALISETIRRGRSVVVLVPEIDRVGGWAARLRSRGDEAVGILHSGLSDRERRAEWERIRRGERPVVVGTRLAVLAPISNPGLIVVEAEEDPAYKQEESPRYHARDVAVLRAAHHGALAILTGRFPSVETYANIQNGKYRSVRLTDPAAEGPVRPSVRILDLARQPRGAFVSEDLLSAVGARLEKKEPVALILNRRGFGSALYCRDCGSVVRCVRCRVAAVYSKQTGRLICPYCGSVSIPPTACSECRGARLEILGAGTERVEEFFSARFPSARIARLDRDTARPDEAAAALERLDRSELDILIGTQLLINGPGMARSGLVGLLLADGAFHLPDFRAGEQTFRLIARILAFSRGGEVILQTYHPTHESIVWAAAGDPKAFYEKELAQRKALGYPPFTRLAVVTVKALKESEAEAAALRLSERLRRAIQRPGLEGIQILGPAAAMRSRLYGKYRRQILIKAPDSRRLHEALQAEVRSARSESGRSRVWLEVDVDPQRIL
ncbi:MAG: primosomal protein N' [Nitrospirae bacterium]|nr:primosomal protein N' [Nitrospirota bacterium]